LEEGEYDLYCTEYCGEKHSKMLGRVYAMSEADYRQWVLDNAKAGTGKEIFNTKCSVCHSLEPGNAEKAPTWHNLYGRTETLKDGTTIQVLDDYIRESIRYPNLKIVDGFETQTSMSPFPKQSVSNEELNNIIDFMKSLSDYKADEANEDPKP
jgi:cytochrome c oxidase subunit 2